MLKIKYHSQFKKDYKAALKSGHDKEDFIRIITLLAEQKPLPQKHRDPMESFYLWKVFRLIPYKI